MVPVEELKEVNKVIFDTITKSAKSGDYSERPEILSLMQISAQTSLVSSLLIEIIERLDKQNEHLENLATYSKWTYEAL